MKKVLIITNNRKDRSPGQRFRFEQYLPFLEKNGFDIEFSYFINEKDDKIIYSKGNLWGKFIIVFKNILLRTKNILQKNRYDVIFIFREATILGFSLFEKALAGGKAKIIFDYDDSIWIQNVSQANKKLAWLKKAEKTANIISISDLVFAGNAFLANYAKKYNNNVVIVPTTIDTDEYIPNYSINKNIICIGWSGSFTTIEHFETCIEALKILKKKYGNKIYFKVIGDKNYIHKELNIEGYPWVKSTELVDLQEIDIGIMPLPNNDWAMGKCGLKGLQYMALSIPTLMSPVGVNKDIIQDGVNGYLCGNTQEWVEKISLLIDSSELREKVGKRGRETVEKLYSVNSNKQVYLNYFKELTK